MTFSRSDFFVMRWNIATLAVSVLLSSLILFASDQYYEHAQTDFRTANAQMREARNRLNNVRMDQEYLATYSKDYSKLEARNIFGDDHRLDWIEGLEQLRRSNLVVDYTYAISPQQIYTPPIPLNSGNFQVNSSEIKFHFDLLHEGQFFKFISALQNQIKGLFQLNSCNFERIASTTAPHFGESLPELGTNVVVECSGSWFTLKNLNEPT